MREFRAVAALAALLIGTVLVACEPPPPPLTILPDDALTVADANQLTGRRMNLPLPDCTTRPSDCDEIRLVNTPTAGTSIRASRSASRAPSTSDE